MREQSIDLIKILAMYGVMVLHTNSGLLDFNSGFVLYTISGLSIPLFFMVSGYLMFNRTVNYSYIFDKVYKILKFCFLNALLFWLIDSILSKKIISDIYNYFPLCFIQEGRLGVFWFFGTMIIIYAILPVLQAFKRKIPYFTFSILLIAFCTCTIIFTFNLTSGFEKNICQTFRLWNALFYFLMGGALRYFQLTKLAMLSMKIKILILLSLFLVYLPLVNQYKIFLPGPTAEYFFGNTLCMLLVILIFATISSIKIKNSLIISKLVTLFLPCYVFHQSVIRVVSYFCKKLSIFGMGEFYPITKSFLVIVLSTFLCYLLMQIPYVKKIYRI